MNKLNIAFVGLALLAAPVLVTLGQLSIEPPPPAPATSTAPAAAPATAPAATLPTAENVLEGLLHSRPTVAPVTVKPSTAPALPGIEAVAPGESKTKLMRERDTIERRVGHLVKDEKTGNWVFSFDGDGPDMNDPPLAIIPSLMLEAMEKLSENGTKPVKFRISGEVTQYKGHNYLIVRYAQVIKDLNTGIGG